MTDLLDLHLTRNHNGAKTSVEHVEDYLLNPPMLAGLISTDTVPLTPRAAVNRLRPKSPFDSLNEKREYVYPSLYHKMADGMAFKVSRVLGYGALMTGILQPDDERTLELLVRRRLAQPWDTGAKASRGLTLIQAIRVTVFVMSRPKTLSRRELAKLAGVTHPTLNKMITELQPIIQAIADEGAAEAIRLRDKIAA